MVGKLFRYDLRAISRVLGPVHGAALALGIVACVCMALAMHQIAAMSGAGANGALPPADLTMAGLTSSIAMMASMLCLGVAMCAPIAVVIVAAHRFYTSLFSGEGYFTFSLPASAGQIVWAKFLAVLVWGIIDAAVLGVVFAGYVVAFCSPFAPAGEALGYLGYALSVIAGGMPTLWQTDAGAVALLCTAGCASSLSGIAVVFFSFALGATATLRHRVAAGIGFYVALSMGVALVNGIIVTTLGFFASVGPVSATSAVFGSMQTYLVVLAVSGAAVFVAGMLGTVALVRRGIDIA